MAYMMEKYKSIIAPCLFHVAANLLSMGLNSLSLNNSWIILALIIVSLCVLAVAVYHIYKNVDPKVEIIKLGGRGFSQMKSIRIPVPGRKVGTHGIPWMTTIRKPAMWTITTRKPMMWMTIIPSVQ